MFGIWKQNRWAARYAARRLNGRTNGHRGFLPGRSALLRFAVVFVTAIVTVFVIDYGGIPFSSRLGQTVQRDIHAKVSFSRVNDTRTARKRDQAKDAVPPPYRHDPRPIEPLIGAIDSLIENLSGAESFEQLPASLVADWNLTAELFNTLRTIGGSEGPQRLAKSIRTGLQSLTTRGILDPDPAEPRAEVRSASRIRIIQESGDSGSCEVSEVARDSLLDSNGPLAQSLIQSLGSRDLGEAVFQLLQPKIKKLPPTLEFDGVEFKLARQAEWDSVPEELDMFDVGERLVTQDQAITLAQLELLKTEHKAWLASKAGRLARLNRTPSLLALILGLFALASYYIARFERRIATSIARVGMLCALIIATVAVSKRLHGEVLGNADVLYGETLPVTLAAMVIAIAYSQQFALLVCIGLGLICAWMFGTGVNDFVVLTGGAAAAVLALNRVRSRTKLITVGFTSAVTFVALTWASGLLALQSPEMLFKDCLFRAMWGVMAGFLMGGSLPFLEKMFGIVTDINLLELSDVSHPLLLDLMRKAPGTYNHSVAVATLAEAAAEQVGANPLVCRVGSYFHDVGKMLKPQYFVENQTDSISRHQTLNPAMSTLIIIGHVKDGADLAHEHHLPQPIIDLIEQHHGTTLVEYFYNEATREVEEDAEKGADVDESAFRYPGPKPQTREACILMLADAVESASRTLSEPTPGRIEGLVHELTLKRLLDGQFDECGITLLEIARIKESLIKSVNAIYHGRVKYPEQRTA
jgi:putative nucleotidyltransferase with HDIG domain